MIAIADDRLYERRAGTNYSSTAVRIFLCALAIACALASAPRARAETYCAPIALGEPALARIDADARLRFIRERLHRAAFRSRIWTLSWFTIYSGVTIYNGVQLGLASNESDRIAFGIGMGASFVGVLSVAVNPPRELFDSPRLEKQLARAAPGDNRCALLTDAERYFLRSAAHQALGKSALIHVGSLVFNAGIGVLLGAGFGRWNDAAQDAFIGAIVGEFQIFTQPSELVQDLARYRAGRLDGGPLVAPRVSWAVAPFAAGGRYGVAAVLSF